MERIKRESECFCCYSKENLLSMLEPYNHEDKLEIYATMIAECFQMELNSYIQEYLGNLCWMCKNCVFRLREAIAFRSQIQIGYHRLQNICESDRKDDHEDISAECSDLAETKENIILNSNTSDLPKYFNIERNEGPVECSDNVEKKENIIKLEMSECDSAGVDSATSFSNKNVLKCKKLDISNSIKEHDNTNGGSDMKSQNTNICNMNIVSEAGSSGRMPSERKNHKCEFCDKHFALRSSLLLHIKVHSNPQKYTCKYCKRILASNNSLLRHEKSHFDIKDYICDYCNKGFILKTELATHMLTHSDGKNRKCKFCEKVFGTKRTLLAHMQLHSNPQKYTCRYCNQILSGTTSLLRHEKIHLNVKDFICDYCNKKFRSKIELERHIPTHSDGNFHKCEFCKKLFSLKNSLLRHVKVHSNPQKYTCEYCNQIFSSTSSLFRHKTRTHPRGGDRTPP